MAQAFRSLRLSALVLAGVVIGAGFERTAFAQPDQPMMHSALDSLNAARGFLQRATADKQGHRLAAMRLVDQAIREVHLGIGAGRR